MFNIGAMFGEMRPFNTRFRAFSAAMMSDRSADIDKGNKIILPPSALDHLTRLNTTYPMLFKITNTNNSNQRITHCGVLEFVAEEGKCLLPYWMMRNLLLEEGEMVQLESTTLPVAQYAKFKPQCTEFLNIFNPRAVLEVYLRNFACLTKGDVFPIHYNDKIYELHVMELKPGNAVSTIECDMNVEFEAAEGSEEATASQEQSMETEEAPPVVVERFIGSGNRVDGKAPRPKDSSTDEVLETVQRGIPNYDYKIGKITFRRRPPPPKAQVINGDKPAEPFGSKGYSLKAK